MIGAVEERELIEGLRRGDRKAFESLLDEYTPSLMRVAMAHVPSRAVAEEVVQETWLGVIKGIGDFEGRSSLRTWVFQILLNIARTRGEREKRVMPFAYFRRHAEEGRDEPTVDPGRFQGRRGEDPGHWSRPPVEWSDPQEQLDRGESRQVMLTAISELPPRQRDVIVLRDLQGWPAEETCNTLGLSETNQRVLLHRARSKVRTALESHFEASGVKESR